MRRTFWRPLEEGGFVKVELDTSALEPNEDLFVESSTVAEHMGLLADLMDVATANLEIAEGALKAVRGQIAIELLDEDRDISQWKVEKRCDADPRVVQGIAQLAKAKGDLAFLKTFSDALRLQSSMVRARTELFLAERHAQPSFSYDDEKSTRRVPVRRRPGNKQSDPAETATNEQDREKARDDAFRKARRKP